MFMCFVHVLCMFMCVLSIFCVLCMCFMYMCFVCFCVLCMCLVYCSISHVTVRHASCVMYEETDTAFTASFRGKLGRVYCRCKLGEAGVVCVKLIVVPGDGEAKSYERILQTDAVTFDDEAAGAVGRLADVKLRLRKQGEKYQARGRNVRPGREISGQGKRYSARKGNFRPRGKKAKKRYVNPGEDMTIQGEICQARGMKYQTRDKNFLKAN